MAVPLKPGWSKPSTILFASDCPTDEKAFCFALAQAVEFRANLIILYVLDTSNDATAQKHRLEPLAERAMDLGFHSEIVVRPGLPADQILSFLREREIDRVVMGARSPGPVGKLLVGSVAEAVLRNANVPVCIVGPNVVEGTYRNPVTRRILCDVSKREACKVVAHFGADLAAGYNANLVLQQVIPLQERAAFIGDLTIQEIEAELPTLVPARLHRKVRIQTRVTLGDPTEELLYQGRAQQANLIVMGAHGASHFAAITRADTVYKVLAYAHCPVITLSPIVLADCGVKVEKRIFSEVNYMAGVV